LKKFLKALVLVLVFTFVFTLAGCSSKKAMTADKFTSIMKDYTVYILSRHDIVGDYDIDEARRAMGDDNGHFRPSALFIDFNSSSDAKKYYDTTTKASMNMINDEDLDATTTSKGSGDYQKFTVTGEVNYGFAFLASGDYEKFITEGKANAAYRDLYGDTYSVIIRDKNTVLFVYTEVKPYESGLDADAASISKKDVQDVDEIVSMLGY